MSDEARWPARARQDMVWLDYCAGGGKTKMANPVDLLHVQEKLTYNCGETHDIMKARETIVFFLLAALLAPALLNAQVIKGTYAIENVETGLLLRPKDANRSDGAPIVLYSPVNWKCMTWDFHHVEGNTYALKNLFTGKTFAPENQSKKASAPLAQIPFDLEDENQYWEFISDQEGRFKIRLKGTALFLTPSDGSGKVNTPLTLKAAQAGNLQLWTIYEQHPTM